MKWRQNVSKLKEQSDAAFAALPHTYSITSKNGNKVIGYFAYPLYINIIDS